MYIIQAVSPVKKDLKRLSPEVVEYIKNHIFPLIKENPHAAATLSGEFSGLTSYHFKFKRVDYRIIYETKDDTMLVRVLMIGSRESLYKKLKTRLK